MKHQKDCPDIKTQAISLAMFSQVHQVTHRLSCVEQNQQDVMSAMVSHLDATKTLQECACDVDERLNSLEHREEKYPDEVSLLSLVRKRAEIVVVEEGRRRSDRVRARPEQIAEVQAEVLLRQFAEPYSRITMRPR